MSFKTSDFSINMSVVILLSLASIFILSIPVQAQDSSCSTSGGFQDNAGDFVTVNYRTRRQGRRIVTVVTNAEILWEPKAMLSDPSCYDVTAAELYMREAGTQAWTISDFDQRPAGRSIKWTVDVKPCLPYEFKIQVTGNDIESQEYFFEIPHILGPATQEQIDESNYTPEPPTGFNVLNLQSDSATVTWEASDCATRYEVSYVEAGKGIEEMAEGIVNGFSADISGLKPCTKYETTVSAILGEEYGDLVTDLATKPRYDAASNLVVELNEDLDAVTISWEAWQSVSCIDKYQVQVCEVDEEGNESSEACNEMETINKVAASPYVDHTVTGLTPCTNYKLTIRPLFGDSDLDSKDILFRTLSREAADMKIDRVGGEVISSSSMSVEWDPLTCAAKYKVWQKEIGVEEWVEVAETESAELTKTTVDNITPCTKYQFAISAVLADGSETEKTAGPELTSALNPNQPFKVPGFHVDNTDTKFDIKWGHADCIESYELKTCPADASSPYTDCIEHTITPGEAVEDKMIKHSIENLEPCTQYALHITPVITGKGPFEPEPIAAQTTNGTPEEPQEFTVEWKSGAALKWARAQCATGYRVYYKMGGEDLGEGFLSEDSEAEASEDTTELEKIFEDTVPCHSYSYSVATVVGEQESTKTAWQNLAIPPEVSAQPNMDILKDRDSNNVTLKITPARGNERCTIDKYRVEYSPDGDKFEEQILLPEELGSNGEIVLSFDGSSERAAIIKARVHYSEPGMFRTADEIVWSDEISTGGVSEPHTKGSGDAELPLIPIVVGVAVLALVVIVVTVVLIKRKKSRNLDPEKAENGKTNHHHNNLANSDEETQKLNDPHA